MPYEALYLHIPFCKSKCVYCDFDSRAYAACNLSSAMDAYVEHVYALLDEHGKAGELAAVQTVYIGGGTPTLLGERLIELVERVHAYCSPVEFTCEANPESFTASLAAALKQAGVTRISLGVQSLNNNELTALGRIHTAYDALLALELAKSLGFSASCDLMCGLPEQTLKSWQKTLDTMLASGPNHISVYPLQLEEGTPLERLEAAGKVEIPSEDFQAECMDVAAQMLASAGYERYEVASYAQPGHACKHNIAYWTGKSYLGLGRSAASMRNVFEDEGWNRKMPPLIINQECCLYRPRADSARAEEPSRLFVRAQDCLSTDDIGSALPKRSETEMNTSPNGRVRFKQLDDAGTQFEHEVLNAREAASEGLMLACRMTCGISPEQFARAAQSIPPQEIEAACEQAISLGLATWEHPSTDALSMENIIAGSFGNLVPTHAGWLEGNELFGIFWGLAEHA